MLVKDFNCIVEFYTDNNQKKSVLQFVSTHFEKRVAHLQFQGICSAKIMIIS